MTSPEGHRPLTVANLSRYVRKGASSRLRSILYFPELQRHGLLTKEYPLFDDDYLDRLYSQRSTLLPVARAMVNRVLDMRRAGRADLLWIEKEVLPWMPWAFEAAVLPRGVPYAVDYDDAIFHRYDLHRKASVRRLLGRKLDHLMAGAALVTAGNGYLAARARAAGAPWVEVVPTVVDIEAYTPIVDRRDGAPCIGWIGSPSTWGEFMAPILPFILETAGAGDAHLLAVGSSAAGGSHARLIRRDWSEETEVDLIRQMDIGIMPLTDTPWSRGKCGYKLIQYMACGLPVIASPVGVNCEIIEHGVTGFLADSPAEWSEALRRLIDDRPLRASMGQAGRRRVERDYSLQVWGPRLAQMLRQAAERPRRA